MNRSSSRAGMITVASPGSSAVTAQRIWALKGRSVGVDVQVNTRDKPTGTYGHTRRKTGPQSHGALRARRAAEPGTGRAPIRGPTDHAQPNLVPRRAPPAAAPPARARRPRRFVGVDRRDRRDA